eukprot:4516426-Prymnesium_polylepis.1
MLRLRARAQPSPISHLPRCSWQGCPRRATCAEASTRTQRRPTRQCPRTWRATATASRATSTRRE